jgi:hypothetical protein
MIQFDLNLQPGFQLFNPTQLEVQKYIKVGNRSLTVDGLSVEYLLSKVTDYYYNIDAECDHNICEK